MVEQLLIILSAAAYLISSVVVWHVNLYTCVSSTKAGVMRSDGFVCLIVCRIIAVQK